MIVAITFDVDCQGYVGESPRPLPDELERALKVLHPVFRRHARWQATWFLRVDPALDRFAEQAHLLHDLTSQGHSLAWHYHGPLDRIAEFADKARGRGLDISRVGYGRGSNQALRRLERAGFRIDSTAMPRPTYPWTRRGVDWSTTPSTPYQPSRSDYRVPGTPSLRIIEVPISCAPVAAPGDDREVVRYLNPAYHPSIFEPSLEWWLVRHRHLITITHPYELLEGTPHNLLAFDAGAFEENVLTIERHAERHGGCDFVTIGELAERRPAEAVSA